MRSVNGPIRQYFPRGTVLSIHSAEDLAYVATELNHRPRKILGWRTPAGLFTELVATLEPSRVATLAGIGPGKAGPVETANARCWPSP